MASTGRIAPQARQGSNSKNLDPRVTIGGFQNGVVSSINSLLAPQLLGQAPNLVGMLAIGSGSTINLAKSSYATQNYGDAVVIGQSYATAVPSITIGANDPARNWGVNSQYGIAIGTSAWVNSSGLRGVALGYAARANASDAVAIGPTNTASGNGSTAIGNNSAASGTGSISIGTSSSTAGDFGVSIGYAAAVANTSSVAIGYQTSAAFNASTGIGYRARTEMNAETRISSGGTISGNFSDVASSTIVGFMQTTNATPTEIGLGNGSTQTAPTNRIILSNLSSYLFNIDIVAQVSGGLSDSAMWTLIFGIQRGANAAATAIIGSPVLTTVGNTAGSVAWTVAVTADTTNGRPSIKVTGVAATTINWVITARMTKIGV